MAECCLIQGRSVDEIRNRVPFPFYFASVDAMLLTHVHLDRSRRLPLLVKAG